MTWRKECETELGAILDDHFPDGVIGRGDAVAIYATALSLINKTILAFGNCENCYGKGYATVKSEIDQIIYCKCSRGEDLEELHGRANV